MTKLNHAFIRAYGKEMTPPVKVDETVEPSTEKMAEMPSPYGGAPVEDLYADGTWYRVDYPTAPRDAAPPERAASGGSRAAAAPAKGSAAAPRRGEAPPSEPAAEPLFPAQALTWDASTFVIMPGLAEFTSDGDGLDGVTSEPEMAPLERAVMAVPPPAPLPPPVAVMPPAPVAPRAPAMPPAPIASPGPIPPQVPETAAGKTVVETKPRSERAQVAEAVSTKMPAPPAAKPVSKPAVAPLPEPVEEPEPEPAPVPLSDVRADERAIVPAWEVSQLLWPSICERLEQAEPDYVPRMTAELQDYLASGIRAVAVTSTRLSEGCTTFALCLARRAAAAGVKVALLDAHLEAPQLASSVGVEAETGWNRALLERLPLGEAAIRSVDDGLTLFPATAADRLPPLSLHDSGVASVLRQIMSEFELVVVDLGPLRPEVGRWFRTEGAIPSLIGGAVVVRNVRITSEDQTLITAARLRSFGADRIGIIENFAARAG